MRPVGQKAGDAEAWSADGSRSPTGRRRTAWAGGAGHARWPPLAGLQPGPRATCSGAPCASRRARAVSRRRDSGTHARPSPRGSQAVTRSDDTASWQPGGWNCGAAGRSSGTLRSSSGPAWPRDGAVRDTPAPEHRPAPRGRTRSARERPTHRPASRRGHCRPCPSQSAAPIGSGQRRGPWG